jgi:hypothetical protein
MHMMYSHIQVPGMSIVIAFIWSARSCCAARWRQLLEHISPSSLQRGAWSSVVGWGTILQAGRSRIRIPMRSLEFFSWLNPSSHTVALKLTQPLKEISTGFFLGLRWTGLVRLILSPPSGSRSTSH